MNEHAYRDVRTTSLSSSRSTFVFADLVGFSALTEAHGDQFAADVVEQFASRVATWLPAFGDGSLKPVGDAVMIRCIEPRGAVELSLALIARSAEVARFPSIRIGMHSGTAVERGGDWYGFSVNLAARVSRLASASEVLLTEQTVLDAGALPRVRLTTLGAQRFHNLATRVEVYRAERPDPPAGKRIDPVCRMPLSEGEALRRQEQDGVEYAFCSRRCERAFLADPDDFVNPVNI
ncbi:YHS domain-containing protein [Thermoleophilia bacterium SCSIO 60948]|nr:YHS domain-containing protein [Thermoleophilia bacterium SCSIO 60948]